MGYKFNPITEIKPVYQTHKDGGTCFMACLATLMGIAHDDVIDVYALWERVKPDHWYDGVVEWCREQGYAMTYLSREYVESGEWQLPEGYYQATWAWERNGEVVDRHEVVYKDGKVAWNPCPGDRRTPDYIEGYYVLEPLTVSVPK